jgi:hypothetical protein
MSRLNSQQKNNTMSFTGNQLFLLGNVYSWTSTILISPEETVSDVYYTTFNQHTLNKFEFAVGAGKTLNINIPSIAYYVTIMELIISAGSTFKVSAAGSIRIYSITAWNFE